MSDLGRQDLASGSLRLETLVRLRWMAVAGQTAAVVAVHFWLGFALPFGATLVTIGAAAALNVWLTLTAPKGARLSGEAAAPLMAFDILQLAALLFLTGGLSNPFAVLLVAPVLVSATTLPPNLTAILAMVVVTVATALAGIHYPLPWYPGEAVELPRLFVAGIWTSIVLTLAFTAIYAYRLAEEARQLARALAETELVLQRAQHLSALDGLAAAAAHALGTPLGTIALVAKELQREVPAGDPIAEDVALIRSQTERCRDILKKLSTLAEEGDTHFDRAPVTNLLEEVAAPHREGGVSVVVDASGEGAAPVGRRDPAIRYGLGNLIENATDFARTEVRVTARWTPEHVSVEIADDGPGFDPQVIGRLGDPFVSSRPRRDEQSGGGLGLGFFIAKTLLMRSGAEVKLANRDAPAHGAIIRLVWKRPDWEAVPPPADLAAE